MMHLFIVEKTQYKNNYWYSIDCKPA